MLTCAPPNSATAETIYETTRINWRRARRFAPLRRRETRQGEKMAALSNSRNTPEMADGGRMRVFPVEANTNIYLGGIVALNAAGNAVPASATTTTANAQRVVG